MMSSLNKAAACLWSQASCYTLKPFNLPSDSYLDCLAAYHKYLLLVMVMYGPDPDCCLVSDVCFLAIAGGTEHSE